MSDMPTTLRTRVPNRTHTDRLIQVLLTREPTRPGGWTYVTEILQEVGVSIDTIRTTSRFLRDEYRAVEYLEISQAVRLAGLKDYATGVRQHDERWAWPAERVSC